MATLTISRPKVSEPDNEFEDWFCIKCNLKFCGECDKEMEFVHTSKVSEIIVWPEKDDPFMLTIAEEAMGAKRNPRIVCYEQNFGPCISFYDLED